jgi:tetratricopeptide (TPR) repeat protein
MNPKKLLATLAVTASLLAPKVASAQPAPAPPAADASGQPAANHPPPTAQPAPTAAPETDEGKARFLRGVDLFRENDFRSALVEFRRSYEISHNYKVLYNIGQTEYELQDYASALKSFQRYLDLGATEIEAGRRAEVEKDLKDLASRVARVEIKSNTVDAEVLVDDVVVGKTPLADPLVVSIGHRKVVLQKNGLVSTARFVDLAGGDRLSVQVDLATAPKEEAAPSRTGMWVSLAITGGLVAGTAIVGGLALAARADAQKQLDTFGAKKADIDAARSKTATLALVADILGGTAIAMTGVTIILGVTSGKSDAPPSPKAAITVGPGGVSVGGRF